MKQNEIMFRDVYHKICYISAVRNFKSITEQFPNADEATGAIAYGYIDHQAGLSFELLACAVLNKDGSITAFNGNDTASIKYRFGSISECEVLIIENDEIYRNRYFSKIQMINEGYKVSDSIEEIRTIEILDACRSPEYPDDVMVVLFKEENQPEGCWVRCEGFGNNGLIGELLNEPNADFTVHMGDIIDFGVIEQDDGFMCVSLFE